MIDVRPANSKLGPRRTEEPPLAQRDAGRRNRALAAAEPGLRFLIMARLMQVAVKNPQALGAIVGGVIGLIVGLIVDFVLFHHEIRGIVFGFVIGGMLGWWQHKLIAARVTKFFLGRASPL